MNILIFTNHDTHSAYDSIFDIAKYLHRPEQGHNVYISSVSNSPAHFQCNSPEFQYRKYTEQFTFDGRDAFCELSKQKPGKFDDFDAIFFRIDRITGQPDAIFDYFNYVETLAKNVKFVNSPRGLSLTKSKQFLLEFSDICPRFVIAKSLEEAFAEFPNQPFVLKPLDGYGGKGIIKVDADRNISVTGENYTGAEAAAYLADMPASYFPTMAMEFLKNVSEGDKRTVVVAGTCLGSVLRIPKEGSWLANLAQGATTQASEPDEDELRIVERIDPILRKQGILVYGIDTLLDNNGKRTLSEINTANVGGFVQIQQTSGKPIISQMADLILENL